MQQLVIADFSGGINTKIAKHLIPDSQCIDMNNVDTETGILEPIRGHTSQGAVGDDHFALLSAGNNSNASPIPLPNAFTYAQSYSSMYTVNTSSAIGGGRVQLWWETADSNGLENTYDLSLESPHSLGLAATKGWPGLSTNIPYSIEYAVTAWDNDRGVESAPAYVTVDVNPVATVISGGTSGATDATGSTAIGTGVILQVTLNVSNTTVDKLKFYRLGKLAYNGTELTEFRYIGEMSASGALGSFVYFFDGTRSENAGEILSTQNLTPYFNLNNAYRCVDVYKDRLFVSETFIHKLWFSGAQSLGAFEYDAWLELTGIVTALASTMSGLYIFTDDGRLSYLTGSTPSDFVIYPIGYSTDCLHPSTIVKGKGYIMWLSKHGIMRASGYTVENLTKNTFINLPDTVNSSAVYNAYSSALVDQTYYFMMGANNILYRYDINQQSLSKLNISGLTQVFPYENRVYGNISNTYYELFSTTPSNSWDWTSKTYVGQSYDSEMEITKIKLAYEGTPTVEVYIDEVLVITHTFANKSVVGADSFMLPESDNKGHGMYLKISGDASTKVYSVRALYDYINLEN